jgi:hypothetical protein
MRGLNRAMKSPWVVMIIPTEEGAAPSPSLIVFNTGARTLPAMIVSVAEARITARAERLDLISQISREYFPLRAAFTEHEVHKVTRRG